MAILRCMYPVQKTWTSMQRVGTIVMYFLHVMFSLHLSVFTCHKFLLLLPVPDSPPTNVQARTVSSTAINASWSEVPAIDQNGIITVYEIMYTPLATFEGAIGTLLVNTSSMSVVLDMLQEDVDYNISVRAYTSQGPGNFSAPITQRTNQDGECTQFLLLSDKPY